MPVRTAINIVSSIMGVTEIHKVAMFFVGHGFTMGIVKSMPLTLWIKFIPTKTGERVIEQEWTFLPHIAGVFRLHKPVGRKPLSN